LHAPRKPDDGVLLDASLARRVTPCGRDARAVEESPLSRLPTARRPSVETLAMPLKTRVTELLQIEHPIVQGGMHHVGYASLAAAVSNAGGLGTVTALTQRTPELLRAEIRKCASLCPGKPFAVNFTLLPSLAPPDYGAYARVIVEEKVPVVETAGRNPGEWIAYFKKHGVTVVHKCVAIKHALTAERLGADCISVDGFECAGHPGEDDVGALVLLAKAAERLTVPYIASGGIGNGRQLAACLALGADGVNMGTRFMATKEAPIKDGIKDALVRGDEKSTTLVMQSVGNTERVYRNAVAEEVKTIEKRTPGKIEAIRHLVSGENYRKSFQETGDPNTSVWSAGIVMGLIDDVPTCAELIERMVADAEAIIAKRLPSVVVRSRL
jgi:nitronate monooxygenase